MAIDQTTLNKLFEYKNGKLYWKTAKAKNINVTKEAGCLLPSGYRQVGVNGKKYYTHRIVYFMFFGVLPEYLDHINCIRDDNRIENLRECTIEENNRNTKKRRNNTSGAKGVTWDRHANKWRARVCANSKNKYIGMYDNVETAKAAVEEARSKLHGSFANHT